MIDHRLAVLFAAVAHQKCAVWSQAQVQPTSVISACSSVTRIAAPLESTPGTVAVPREPTRTITVELEQKQNGMVLMLQQLLMYEGHFELHYLWIRPPLPVGFAFVPRIIFFISDNLGTQWAGDRGGMLLARPELVSNPNQAVYQGNARFRPLPPTDARTLIVRAADPHKRAAGLLSNWKSSRSLVC